MTGIILSDLKANLGDQAKYVKERLRMRAARHGRSMEAEARSILSEAMAGDRDPSEPNLADAIRRRFAPLGGVDLELPPAESVDVPPSFDP
jgi:plasmid stability protein